MKSAIEWAARVIVVTLIFATGVRAQNTDTVPTPAVKIQSFVELQYPTLARKVHAQGVVVLRAHLDGSGDVVSATAISGSPYLATDSIENIKKWHFDTTVARPIIIVYDFRISEGLCASDCRSQFLFRPPNLVTITVGSEPTAGGSGYPASTTLTNEDVTLMEYAQPTYPVIAIQARIQGVVVVQIQVDRHGDVVSTQPIVGPAMLIYAAVENVKKWRFSPGKPATSVIVYDFEIDGGLANCAHPCPNSVSVREPNFMTIMGGHLIMESVNTSKQ